MKAAVCREFGQDLVIEDVNLRAPEAGEVEVDVAACAICHSDLSFADGIWGGVLPAVYGHEAAGHIRSVGEGVAGYAVGDAVLVTLIRACGTCSNCAADHPTDCETPYDRMAASPITDASGAQLEHGMATGAFAERVVVDQSQIVKLPADMNLKTASLLACGAVTGIGAVLNSAKMAKGASVVVVGAGGVGLNTVQGAKLAGASQIIVVDLDAGKLGFAKEFGATDGVIASAHDMADQIRALTNGRGADYVFVTVGAIQAYQAALDYMAARGEMVMVGMPAVGAEMHLEPVNLAGASQVLRGTKMGDTVLQRDIPKMIEWYQSGALKLDELVAAEFTLDQINEAMEATRQGSAGRNVIVFD